MAHWSKPKKGGVVRTETRRERILRLENDFCELPFDDQIVEYTRCKLALDGDLPIPLPRLFVEDCRDALYRLLKNSGPKKEMRRIIKRCVRVARHEGLFTR